MTDMTSCLYKALTTNKLIAVSATKMYHHTGEHVGMVLVKTSMHARMYVRCVWALDKWIINYNQMPDILAAMS